MKPILLGMNNPQHPEPGWELWPDPVGSAGWRLWRMVDNLVPMPKARFLALFERRNILYTKKWDMSAAWAAIDPILPDLLGRRVVMLGRSVCTLCRRGEPEWVVPYTDMHGTVWRAIPHPSGRTREYNNPWMARIVGTMLVEMLSEEA